MFKLMDKKIIHNFMLQIYVFLDLCKDISVSSHSSYLRTEIMALSEWRLLTQKFKRLYHNVIDDNKSIEAVR